MINPRRGLGWLLGMLGVYILTAIDVAGAQGLCYIFSRNLLSWESVVMIIIVMTEFNRGRWDKEDK